MPDRLDPIRDLARSINDSDEEWERKKARADAEIDEGRVLVEAAKRELADGTVTRIHQKPTAAFEWAEDDLRDAIKHLTAHWNSIDAITPAWHRRLEQLLKIESGPGGRFRGDAA